MEFLNSHNTPVCHCEEQAMACDAAISLVTLTFCLHSVYVAYEIAARRPVARNDRIVLCFVIQLKYDGNQELD